MRCEHRKTQPGAVSVALALCGLLLATALAQADGPYDLSWYTIDGGGATFSADSSFSLGGTIGQPDAGSLSGGTFILGGGFWGGGDIFTAVMLGEHGIVSIEEGVRIFWSLSADVTALSGYEIERGVRDQFQLITSAPLPACHACEFIDRAPPVGDGPVDYRLIVLFSDGGREVVDLGQWTGQAALPTRPILRQPSPHPIGQGISLITVGLPAAQHVRIEAFDISGRRVAVIRDESLPAGWSHVSWDGSGLDGHPLSAGFYVMRLSTREGTSTRKVIVVK